MIRMIEKEEFTIVSLLKACAKNRDLIMGLQLHALMMKRGGGLSSHSHYLCSALINMYAKCGALSKARQVIEEIPHRHITVWNALISGYTKLGHGHEAFSCYEEMQREGLFPDVVTFTSILKACGCVGAVEKGKEVHEKVVSRGLLKKDVMLGNALVDMYAKCGMLVKAQEVIEDLPIRNAVTWSGLMAGYAQQGQSREALNCFERMQSEGVDLDTITFVCVLKACSSTRSIDKGRQIHDEIVRRGLLAKENMVIGVALVDMYAKCGVLEKAQEVFEELPIKDTVAWNALICGYVQEYQNYKALNCYQCMQNEGLSPDATTLTCILKACGRIGLLGIGERIHEDIVSRGFLKKDIVLGNALVDMYAKCGMLAKALEALRELPIHNVVSWSSLIAGYVQEGQSQEALTCFEWMQNEGISPDVVTFICILKACGIARAIDKGKQIHNEIVRRGLLKNDTVLGTALVDMYVKCGAIAKAQEVLHELPERDIVSWVALITGYAEQGQLHEALNCYECMGKEGLSPTAATFVCILKACGNTGAIDKGKQMHDEIVIKGLLEEKDAMLGTSLVDMYARCGALAKAQEVLEQLRVRDVVSWSALIAGYAHEGQGHEALKCLTRMQSEGLSPDEVTFTCVMKACTHGGLTNEAQMLFADMSKGYSIAPSLEHHTSMVTSFGYGGHFDKAMEVMEAFPSSNHVELWIALLGACRKWGNVKIGRLAFHQAMEIDHGCGAAYTLMNSIFAAAGMQEDAKNVEAMRLKYFVGNQLENSL